MRSTGIQASKLIAQLQALVTKYGDQEVFAGGGDYPSGVGGVTVQREKDPYVPKGVFYVRGKSL